MDEKKTSSDATRVTLKASLRDGLAYSLMVGLGETFFAAFVLAKGFSEIKASLISTTPLLLGAILQLLAPLGILWLKSYRKWVLYVALAQALSLWALALVALWPRAEYAIIFALVAAYWGAGMAIGPAWNAWLGSLVPVKLRTQFFSSRGLWCHVFTFLGLAAGGLILNLAKTQNWLIMGFSSLFFLAGLFRLASVYYLSRHAQGHSPHSEEQTINLNRMHRLFQNSPIRKFMIFLLLFQTATNFSASLFTPYMLSDLKLDYTQYMLLLASSLMARVITLNFAKSLLNRISLQGVFFTAVGICAAVPILWTTTRDYSWLVFFQVLSGVGWGFYELIAFLTLFNDLPMKDRSTVLTFYNFLQTLGVITGAVFGGLLFQSLGHNTQAYYVLFEGSTYLRFLTLLALPGFTLKAVRIREWIELRPFSVRAHGGLFSRPIIVRIPLPATRRKGKNPSRVKDNEA